MQRTPSKAMTCGLTWRVSLGLLLVLSVHGNLRGQTPERTRGGHLMIVGGGLRVDNRAVFEKLIELAGGPERAQIVVLPTASIDSSASYELCKRLTLYGIAPEQAEVLNVTEVNAAVATTDPAILDKVRRATGVFLSGGDQRRLVRLLTTRAGTDTPLLAEIRNVLARGGVIAGSSAGASAQSKTMLAVSGLPDVLLDEGLDTLDYGITSHTSKRGLLITRGFGFFDAGIIDQHFFQFRGRLGRLTRATADCEVPLGFGIDENTAMIVAPDGRVHVLGPGFLTIIQPGKSRGTDGPMGYKINDITLSLLSAGDQFDPSTGQTTVAPEKALLTPDKVEFNGNFLLNDISAGGEGVFALVNGLAENRKTVQEAVALKFHGDAIHGYRFRFSKRPMTQAYAGYVDHSWTYTVLNVRLDISPIAGGLKPAETQMPRDLPEGSQARKLAAVAFRGLLPANSALEFRPDAVITRGEFAHALARSVHLPAAPEGGIIDVERDTLEGEEIARVIAAGLMGTFNKGAFHPSQPLAPASAADGLLALAQRSQPVVAEELTVELKGLEHARAEEITRARIGILLHRILELPE